MELRRVGQVCLALGAVGVLILFTITVSFNMITTTDYVLSKSVQPNLQSSNASASPDSRGSFKAGTQSNVPRYNRHAVVCMIFTTPNNWETKGRAVRLTWAPRCPYSLIFYSNSSASLDHAIRKANNTVALDLPDGRHVQTQKTLAAMRYSFAKYGDVAEWFMKVDDDTYVVWENLEKLLDTYVKQNVSYFGYRYIVSGFPKGYAIGGCYVMHPKAVALVINEGRKFPTECHQEGEGEDVDIASCLAHFGIYPTDTRDQLGRERFHQENPMLLLDGHVTYAHVHFADVTYGDPQSSVEWLSPETVTFHHVSPGNILMFDYLLYHLHRDGRQPQQFINSMEKDRRQ